MVRREVVVKGLVDQLVDAVSDGHLSRGERHGAREALAELSPTRRVAVRREVLDRVVATVKNPDDRQRMEALVDLVAIFDGHDASPPRIEAFFGPEDPMVETLLSVVQGASRSLDIAVFTLTDDRLSAAIQRRYEAGTVVRIISDDDKAKDPGSDIDRLARAGVDVRTDRSPHHFHHKFAIADDRVVVTGSYNWTRSAARDNRENFVITEDRRAVGAFGTAFDKLWHELAPR